MYQLILVIHVIVAIILIGLILIQCGKGAAIGASFGSGASNTVFGSQGTGGFLFKLTSLMALLFFMTSLGLSYLVSLKYQKVDSQEINIPVPPVSTWPQQERKN